MRHELKKSGEGKGGKGRVGRKGREGEREREREGGTGHLNPKKSLLVLCLFLGECGTYFKRITPRRARGLGSLVGDMIRARRAQGDCMHA